MTVRLFLKYHINIRLTVATLLNNDYIFKLPTTVLKSQDQTSVVELE